MLEVVKRTVRIVHVACWWAGVKPWKVWIGSSLGIGFGVGVGVGVGIGIGFGVGIGIDIGIDIDIGIGIGMGIGVGIAIGIRHSTEAIGLVKGSVGNQHASGSCCHTQPATKGTHTQMQKIKKQQQQQKTRASEW